MKCVSCRSEVSAGAKFCGNCGTKVATAAVGPIEVTLAPSPLSLASCSVTLLETTAVGPDDDGDIRVTARFRVENETDEDWDYLEAQMQLLDSNGLVVDSTTDTYEQSVDAGDSEEFESNLYGVRLKALGENAEEAQVYIQVIASKKVSRSLGSFPLTRPAYEGYALQPVEFDGYLKLLTGRLSTTDPDSDGDVRFEAKAMLQNLTVDYSPKVSLTGTVSNAKEEEVLTIDASVAIQPGAVTVVSDNSFAKKKMFKGATAEMELSAYVQLAEGFASGTGLSILAEETKDEDEDEERDTPEYNSDASGSDFVGTRRFYGNMKWFSVAEQPQNFDQLPAEFGRAKKLWDKNSEGNIGKIIELLSPYVGARFIACNISGWEELFADFDGSGFCEIESNEVRVVGIDFSESPIPMCKAEAHFEVPVTKAFESADLDEWQNENGHFTDAVIFYWNVPRSDVTEDLDFTCGSNLGAECIALKSEDSLLVDGKRGGVPEKIVEELSDSASVSVFTDHAELRSLNLKLVLGEELEGIENKIMETGLLSGSVPYSDFDVQLRLYSYSDSDGNGYLLTIDIGCDEDFDLDECRDEIGATVAKYLLMKYDFDSVGLAGLRIGRVLVTNNSEN